VNLPCRRAEKKRLLRTPEQSAVDGFREDMTLDRFHHVRARLERVGGRLHVDDVVQGIEFEHVVMLRTVRASAGTAIHLAGCAELKGAVCELGPFGTPFGQARGRRRNVPHHPMRLIVRRLVRATSMSRMLRKNDCVPAGTLVQLIAGDSPSPVATPGAAWLNFTGTSPPSGNPVTVNVIAGAAGAAPRCCAASGIAARAAIAEITNHIPFRMVFSSKSSNARW